MIDSDKITPQQYEDAMIGYCEDFAPDVQAQCDCVNCGEPYEKHTIKHKAAFISGFCAITCTQDTFLGFLGEKFSHYTDGKPYNKNLATVFVKDWCGVSSFSELARDEVKRALWKDLQSQYQEWMKP